MVTHWPLIYCSTLHILLTHLLLIIAYFRQRLNKVEYAKRNINSSMSFRFKRVSTVNNSDRVVATVAVVSKIT